MKNIITKILVLLIFSCFLSCTENSRAKSFGNNFYIQLEPNEKFINATWKGDDLWYITKKMQPTDIAEIYSFKEKSAFGIFSGEVVFIERKDSTTYWEKLK